MKTTASKRAPITIRRIGNGRAVVLASMELAKYLRKMTGKSIKMSISTTAVGRSGIWVGTFSDLGMPVDKSSHDIFDDHIRVDAGMSRVVISGNNQRSVLFAAYRWLEELGCRWFRPGRDGERVPSIRSPFGRPVHIDEHPSCRHRCICIEGSCSREHVLNMIDYAPKRGFNSYFLQFRTSYTFFNRWYSVENRKEAGRKAFSVNDASAIYRKAMDAALARGLCLHMVGHGWTCEPFGISGLEWKATAQEIPSGVEKYFAEVKGKRELWGGIPLNTQLCYSSPKVRNLMAKAVGEYAAANRDVDVIHVWLADGSNNFCECPGCRKDRPGDLYVKILNEIDKILSEKKLTVKIVFLAYVDLLWAPVHEKISNPSRFILMFAPITRSYSHPFVSKGQGDPEKPMAFKLNELKFPASPQANLELFAGWGRAFPAQHDRVDFDYHLWRDWCCDPGQMQMSKVIHADACSLEQLGMQGFISCQAQRVSFPTGLPMHVLGSALWNRNANFAELCSAYFQDCFGKAGPAVKEYLAKISGLFDPPYMRGEKKGSKADLAQRRKLAQIPGLVRKFQPQIDELCRSSDPVTAANGRILQHHAWYVTEISKLHSQIIRGGKEASTAYESFNRELDLRLPELEHVLDTWTVKCVLEQAMRQAEIPFTGNIVPA